MPDARHPDERPARTRPTGWGWDPETTTLEAHYAHVAYTVHEILLWINDRCETVETLNRALVRNKHGVEILRRLDRTRYEDLKAKTIARRQALQDAERANTERQQ